MNHADEIDHAEHAYLDALCPLCDHSPCVSGDGKGGCEPAELERLCYHADYCDPTDDQPCQLIIEEGLDPADELDRLCSFCEANPAEPGADHCDNGFCKAEAMVAR